MTGRRKAVLVALALVSLLGAAVYLGLPHFLRTADDQPPLNTVVIDDRLATSGQPSAAQLHRLRAAGYEAVINLAPPDSYGAVGGEARIVAALGMDYLNIPVDWHQPTAADLDRFRAALDGWRGRKLWVHCQLNRRASVFVLLRRVLDERVPLAEGLAAVHAVWVPNERWAGFIRDALGRHGVTHDPDELR
jgi:protein tyrosine phosphatase (PTP) superfamily phosphohydrolase (DUF442 family)